MKDLGNQVFHIFKQCATKAVGHMSQEQIFLLDSHDNVVGVYTTPEEIMSNQLLNYFLNHFLESLKRQKIDEIRIEMKKYGITIDDLKQTYNEKKKMTGL